MHTYPVEMAQNFWTAILSFSTAATVAIVVSLLTQQPKTDGDLVGLVYQLTPKDKLEGVPWYQRPAILAIIVLCLVAIPLILLW